MLSLVLVDADGAALDPWEPGAHLDVRFANGVERQYSLCGPVDDPKSYRVAVLREKISRGGSSYVHEHLRAGDLVVVHEPRNNFRFLDSPRYRFVAGGIGITPLVPMVAAASARGADWRLLYGGRTRPSMAFLAELAGHGDRVTCRPQDDYGLLDLAGWLGEVAGDTLVYCCGPEPLLRAIEDLSAGWPAGRLQLERFSPRPEAPATERERSFQVVCKRSGCTVTVEPGLAILETVRAAGVDWPSSCEEGICSTCETRVIDGTPEHRDSVLSSSERAEGSVMMICVSRSVTPQLVLDL